MKTHLAQSRFREGKEEGLAEQWTECKFLSRHFTIHKRPLLTCKRASSV